MPHVQYFPFPMGSISLFRSKYMKLIFSIHVPNIYEFETFMLQVILQEQMRIFITGACFGTRDLLGSLYVIQKLSVGYEVHLFVCFRHTPSMYPISTAGAGFRSPYPSSLPITSTSLSR